MSAPKIPSWVESAPASQPPEGALAAGAVFTDGELDEVRSVEPVTPEAITGEPAVNWRGLPDPVDGPVEAPMPKRGRPRKKR